MNISGVLEMFKLNAEIRAENIKYSYFLTMKIPRAYVTKCSISLAKDFLRIYQS